MSTGLQNSSIVTRQHILDYAINFLRERDSASLRVMDVATACSVSPSAIYTYFRSREGLVEEACLSLYEEISVHLVSNVRQALEYGLTHKSFMKGMSHFMDDPVQIELLTKQYELHLRIVTMSFTNKNFRKRMQHIEHAKRDQLLDIYQTAMDKGILPNDRSARRWMMFFHFVVLNEVIFADLDGYRPKESWMDGIRDHQVVVE